MRLCHGRGVDSDGGWSLIRELHAQLLRRRLDNLVVKHRLGSLRTLPGAQDRYLADESLRQQL